MAEDHGGGGGGGGGILIAIFLVVLASWLMAGAAHRLPLSTIFSTRSPFGAFSSTSPFSFKLPIPTVPMPGNGGIGSNQGVAINDYSSDIVPAPTYTGVSGSPFQESVQFADVRGAAASDPSQEYIVLTANRRNTNPVVITGWRIESSTSGKGVTIGGGVINPVSGATENEGPIVLYPGDRAIVTTGRAPVGVSFRENECTGYFGKFQPFTPGLANYCPSAGSDLARFGGALNAEEQCVGTAQQLSSCTTVTSAPVGVSQSCTAFLEHYESYNGCLSVHQNDGNFELPVWRVYLGQNHELWNNSHDYLELLDADGNLVSSATY